MKYFLLVLFMVNLAFSGRESYEKIVAVVDGKIILHSELMQAVYQLQNVPGYSGLSSAELKKRVLDRLIDDKVIQARAQRDSLFITDEEVDQRVEAHIENLSRSQKVDRVKLSQAILSQTGMTMEQYREKLAENFKNQAVLQKVRFKYVGAKPLTPKEVQSFYAEYKDSLPLQYNTMKVRHIQTKVTASRALLDSVRTDAQRIIDQLEKGASFENLAREYSQDPSGTNGGDIGYYRRGNLDADYERAAFLTDLGKFYKFPVKTALGYHIIKKLAEKDNEIRTAQILFKVIPTTADTLRAFSFVDSLGEVSTKGADFGALADKHSEDKTTVGRGGSLGWFESGELEPEYNKVLMGLNVGEISEPVLIGDSWHIFWLEKRADQRMLTLQDDWKKLEEMASNIYANRKLETFVEKWRTETYIDIRDPEVSGVQTSSNP
jgi:peptidyl-prolyl cis-trans isomerase SurA